MRAGTGVPLPACESGMSGPTSELWSQSLRDIMAKGDRTVSGRRENNGVENCISYKEKRARVHIFSMWPFAG